MDSSIYRQLVSSLDRPRRRHKHKGTPMATSFFPLLMTIIIVAMLSPPPFSIFSSPSLPLLCTAERLQGNKENVVTSALGKEPFFGDKEREILLRKVLRQSGFNTEEEIDDAIIALGPPPEKKLRKLTSDELSEQKQENFDEN